MADIHHTSHSTSYSTSHTPHGRYKVHVTGSDDQVESCHYDVNTGPLYLAMPLLQYIHIG